MVDQDVPETSSDPRLLLLDGRDNVLVAKARIRAGEAIRVSGIPVTLSADVPLGHKLARADIRPGDKVLKYGAPIGSATAWIGTGEHVHVHNIKSDYTPSYTLSGEDQRYGEGT
jgi:altronate dehydratase